jgi:predicted transcriptional regulator
METQEIRTLKILEEIESGSQLSQRYLAKQLDISLGLANSFLKRLAKKGYFKVKTIPKNRVKYILTPKGAFEKTRLTYAYIQYSLNFYRDARQKIKRTLNILETAGVRNIVFYGMSDLTEITQVSLKETSLKLKAVVDDNNKGGTFLGHSIQSTDVLDTLSFDKILITAIDRSRDPVDELLEHGIPKNKIVLIR